MANDYFFKKQAKEEARFRAARKITFNSGAKRAALFIVGIAIVFWIGWRVLYNTNDSSNSNASEVISYSGIHWHSKLIVIINGEKIKIPANIGLGVIHNPLHTHDDTGVIHLEFSGLATTEGVKLKRFFEVWGKTLTNECVFDYCANGSTHSINSGQAGLPQAGSSTLTMAVNGEENTDLGNYSMKDNDKILLSFGEKNAVELSKENFDLEAPVPGLE